MTENEAKNLINLAMPNGNGAMDIQLRGALRLAIQALEEIQRQKTKIGMFVTLEERMEISSRFAKLEQYESIGTIEELQALKEKNEPKKLLHNGANWYRCPNGCEVHKKTFEKDWHCPNCGQKLDWQ